MWKKNWFRIAALNDSLPVLPSLFTLGRKHIVSANFRVFLLDPISGTKILHLHRFSLTGYTLLIDSDSIDILGQRVLGCGRLSYALEDV